MTLLAKLASAGQTIFGCVCVCLSQRIFDRIVKNGDTHYTWSEIEML